MKADELTRQGVPMSFLPSTGTGCVCPAQFQQTEAIHIMRPGLINSNRRLSPQQDAMQVWTSNQTYQRLLPLQPPVNGTIIPINDDVLVTCLLLYQKPRSGKRIEERAYLSL